MYKTGLLFTISHLVSIFELIQKLHEKISKIKFKILSSLSSVSKFNFKVILTAGIFQNSENYIIQKSVQNTLYFYEKLIVIVDKKISEIS